MGGLLETVSFFYLYLLFFLNSKVVFLPSRLNTLSIYLAFSYSIPAASDASLILNLRIMTSSIKSFRY